MVLLERSKKKVQSWKKAMFHFSLCFVVGFFTGFAPTGRTLFFSSQVAASNISESVPHIMAMSLKDINASKRVMVEAPVVNPISSDDSKTSIQSVDNEVEVEDEEEDKLTPRRFIILVTPTSSKIQFQTIQLRRLANTIKLVPQPLLWVVVEGQTDSDEVSEILRKTGIMYRHLVSKENFTDMKAELSHQRNLALKHIEQHRLSGIIHFAELDTVYDLEFFSQLRDIELFGTWPVALLAANRKNVMIEGPVCDSSQVIGWHIPRRSDNETEELPALHISSFAFNSSIFWDPERWGRTSAIQDTSQDSIKFIQQVFLEDETKLKGIPPEDCSRVLLWRLNLRAATKPQQIIRR